MQKLHLKNILLYLVMCAFVIIPLRAETPKDNVNYKNKIRADDTRKEDRAEIKEKRVTARCENVAERVEQKVERYNNNRQIYVEKYQNLKDRIATWSNRLEKDGYDVAELDAALIVLDGKIEALADLHSEFITNLDSVKDYECGNSDGAYAQALMNSKKALESIRDGVQDIRKYYLTTVKPLVQNLRNEVVQNNRETTESADN